jgi:hypothetical protein
MKSAELMSARITTVVAVASVDAKEIMDAEVVDEDGEDDEDEKMTAMIIKKCRMLQL